MFESVGDGSFLERVFRDHREMFRVVDGHNPGTRLPAAPGVLAFLVHLKPVGVVFVVADTDGIFVELFDQAFEQGGLAHTGKPGKADERRFESFPVTVHEDSREKLSRMRRFERRIRSFGFPA